MLAWINSMTAQACPTVFCISLVIYYFLKSSETIESKQTAQGRILYCFIECLQSCAWIRRKAWECGAKNWSNNAMDTIWHLPHPSPSKCMQTPKQFSQGVLRCYLYTCISLVPMLPFVQQWKVRRGRAWYSCACDAMAKEVTDRLCNFSMSLMCRRRSSCVQLLCILKHETKICRS